MFSQRRAPKRRVIVHPGILEACKLADHPNPSLQAAAMQQVMSLGGSALNESIDQLPWLIDFIHQDRYDQALREIAEQAAIGYACTEGDISFNMASMFAVPATLLYYAAYDSQHPGKSYEDFDWADKQQNIPFYVSRYRDDFES